eukprot:4423957-Pyramimonas_sp.AAC.1
MLLSRLPAGLRGPRGRTPRGRLRGHAWRPLAGARLDPCARRLRCRAKKQAVTRAVCCSPP